MRLISPVAGALTTTTPRVASSPRLHAEHATKALNRIIARRDLNLLLNSRSAIGNSFSLWRSEMFIAMGLLPTIWPRRNLKVELYTPVVTSRAGKRDCALMELRRARERQAINISLLRSEEIKPCTVALQLTARSFNQALSNPPPTKTTPHQWGPTAESPLVCGCVGVRKLSDRPVPFSLCISSARDGVPVRTATWFASSVLPVAC